MKTVDDIEDYDRRNGDADRYSSTATLTSRTWKDSDGYSEPVECELARSGRRMMAEQYHTDHHVSCSSAAGRYDHDHQHAVADLDDIQVDWGWTDDATHDERPPSVDYKQQLQRHGWRMEVHGDPLSLK